MKYHIDFDLDFKRNSYPGKLIVVEGIDGSGKTTQAQRLHKKLSKKHKTFLTKNPTDGPIGQLIRKALINKIEIPSMSMQYLFSADRQAQQVEIIEHLKKGEIVISDRYFWSSLAYGIVDRHYKELSKGQNLLLISQSVLSHFHQFILPDMTIYLDVSVDVAYKRLKDAQKAIYELYERKEHLTKVKQAYDWLIKNFKNEWTVIDASANENKITENIEKQIAKVI